MSRVLIVTPDVEADILDGYRSYEEKPSGLGYRFLDEIEKSLARIEQNPFQYQEVELDLRRAVVHISPYLMFYIFGRDSVHVLAVIHGAQDLANTNRSLAPNHQMQRTGCFLRNSGHPLVSNIDVRTPPAAGIPMQNVAADPGR